MAGTSNGAHKLFVGGSFSCNKLSRAAYIVSRYHIVYCFGVGIVTNCSFDSSAPKKYTATVLSKRISAGKTTSYYIKLSAWGLQKTPDEVDVSKNLYKQLEENSEVKIYFMEGRWGIPWFVVDK